MKADCDPEPEPEVEANDDIAMSPVIAEEGHRQKFVTQLSRVPYLAAQSYAIRLFTFIRTVWGKSTKITKIAGATGGFQNVYIRSVSELLGEYNYLDFFI
jgi:hypothetical protein